MCNINSLKNMVIKFNCDGFITVSIDFQQVKIDCEKQKEKLRDIGYKLSESV